MAKSNQTKNEKSGEKEVQMTFSQSNTVKDNSDKDKKDLKKALP